MPINRVRLLEELSHWNPEGVRQFYERSQSEILFSSLDGSGERPRKVATVRKLFLRPLPFLPQRTHALTQAFSDCRSISHPPYDQPTAEYRQRSVVGRSDIGVFAFNKLNLDLANVANLYVHDNASSVTKSEQEEIGSRNPAFLE
jgi:hypothetical protein